MKTIITSLLIILNSVCYGQDSSSIGKGFRFATPIKNDIGVYPRPQIYIDSTTEQDSLTAEKFFMDSIGAEYMVEYTYYDDADYKFRTSPAKAVEDYFDGMMDSVYSGRNINIMPSHRHYIANCSIIKYKGNKQQTLYSGIKAIYSPVDCAADSPKLWLERLYKLQNSRK